MTEIRPTVVVVIPCLNEEQFIGDIVIRSKQYADKVIVVDDGSDDHTSDVAQAAGAEVVRHKTRQGAGAATRTGFEVARKNKADIVVTLDGDAQHNPDEIPIVIAPIVEGKADMVIGSRFVQADGRESNEDTSRVFNIPWYRKYGIDAITWLYNVVSNVKVTDSQSCFRAHSRRLLEAIDITDEGFGFSVEMLIQTRKKGLTISEVPVTCIYHSQSSSLNPVSHMLSVIFSMIKLRIRHRA